MQLKTKCHWTDLSLLGRTAWQLPGKSRVASLWSLPLDKATCCAFVFIVISMGLSRKVMSCLQCQEGTSLMIAWDPEARVLLEILHFFL